MSCYETCIANIAKYYRGEYQLLFSPFFDLKIDDKKQLFVNRISNDTLNDCYQIVENREYNLRKALKIINENLMNKHPVLICLLTKYCNFIQPEDDIPAIHIILVTNFADDGYYCYSHVKYNQQLKISTNELIKGFYILYYFTLMCPQKIDPINIMKKHILSLNLSEQYQIFYSIISKLGEEYEYSYLKGLDRSVAQICGKRALFAEFLYYVMNNQTEYKQLNIIYNEVLSINELWKKLRNLLSKIYFTKLNSQNKKTVLELIEILKNKECKIQKLLILL